VAATSSAPATRASAASPTGSSTFLAQGQDVSGTLLHRPACHSGCPLSGDSTAILDTMTWRTWSATKAVGTGIYKLDGCNPDCAAGPVYPVATVVTLSDPVKACSSSGTRWVWTRASFRFPHGLPKALHGDSAPKNPWVFSTVISAAQRSCPSSPR
jgi:phage tail protein X